MGKGSPPFREVNMPAIITLHDVALRLLLDVVAAGVIGINRDEHYTFGGRSG
jgi:hypothetical protein